MPIYLRSTPGIKKGGDITGPYEESKIERLLQYAQSLSDRNKNMVEVIWVCGRRTPMRFAIYKEGTKRYPKNPQEERTLTNVSACISRPGAESKSLERAPRVVTAHTFSRLRSLPKRFACPAKIVSSQPLQDFTMPSPVTDVGGEKVLGEPNLTPPGFSVNYGPSMPPFWAGRSNLEPNR